MPTFKNTLMCIGIASCLSCSTAVAAEAQVGRIKSEPQGRVDLQARKDTISERRNTTQERAMEVADVHDERAATRTQIFEQAANVEVSDVEARLSATEQNILMALAEADSAAIALTANEVGQAALKGLEQAPRQFLSADQLDTLVVAAAHAATISEEDVDKLLKQSALAIQAYEGLNAEQITASINKVGASALDIQAGVQAQRPSTSG